MTAGSVAGGTGTRRRPPIRLIARTAGFNVGTTAISAVSGVLIARWLGPAGRGNYAAVLAFFGISLIVFELGQASSVVYHVARFRSAHGSVVRTATVMLFPLGVIAALAAVLLGLTVFGDSPVRRGAFLVLPAAILIAFAGAAASAALQSLNLASWNFVRLVQPLVFLVLLVGAHAVVGLRVGTVIGLLAASLAIQSGLAWGLYLRARSQRGEFRGALVRPMLRFGILNMSSSTPNAVNARVDQLVLALVVSSAALGQYAVAVTLSTLAAPLVTAFGHVAFPRLAGGAGGSGQVRAIAVGALLTSVVMLVPILVVGPFLVPVVFGPGYDHVVVLLFILAPGACVVAVNQVLGDVLRGLGRPGAVAVCEWTGVAATVAGLLVLTPVLGTVGAAATSSAAYLVVFTLLARSVHRATAPAARQALSTQAPGKGP